MLAANKINSQCVNIYVLYFSIDATPDDGSLGRLVNDSYYFANATMKRIAIDGKHHLYLKALRNIAADDEILYTYGETDLDWHKDVRKKICF